MEIPYIDFHTHNGTGNDNLLECLCGILPLNSKNLTSSSYLQIGIHPWYIENDQELMAELRSLSFKDTVLAIGEIGLDKIKGGDWTRQIYVFEQQVEWASKIRKPIVIHCVKAFEETLTILDNAGFEQPVIFHGFHGSKQLAIQLTNKGYYLSFGAELFKDNKKAKDSIKNISANQFFLETDDSTYCIEEIYKKVSIHRNVTLEYLKYQQLKNFTTLFPSYKL